MALVTKNPPANAGDLKEENSIPGSERSPGRGYGNPLQYSCLENPMDRGSWQATVLRVAQGQTHLKQHTYRYIQAFFFFFLNGLKLFSIKPS